MGPLFLNADVFHRFQTPEVERGDCGLELGDADSSIMPFFKCA